MVKRVLRGGFSFSGRAQRPLFVSASITPREHNEQVRLFAWIADTARLQPDDETRAALSWIHAIPNGAHLTKPLCTESA